MKSSEEIVEVLDKSVYWLERVLGRKLDGYELCYVVNYVMEYYGVDLRWEVKDESV